MRIAIDISQVIYEGTGVARFTKGLVESILEYDKKNTWTFFFSSLRRSINAKLLTKITESNHALVTALLPPTFLDLVWNKLHRVPIERFTGPQDLIITSDWTEPPSSCPKATIVHDLVYLRYPETVDRKITNTLEKKLKWVNKESKHIFADSQSTKNDLIKYFHTDRHKVHVAYPGVEIQEPSLNYIQETRQKYKLQKQFILTVGKIEPRKNIKKLIEAYDKLGNQDIDMVIVGPPGWEEIKVEHQSNIHFLGYVDDRELVALYSSCLIFAYPSLWEGFGYPVIEAMKLGAPVLTSNNSSLKEIAEGAALLCKPESTESITSGLKKLIHEDTFRTKLIEKGRARSEKFTWKNYYNSIMEVLE